MSYRCRVAAMLLLTASTAAAQVSATSPSTEPTSSPTSRRWIEPATRPVDLEEAGRLHALGKRDIPAHDPSTIMRDGDAYYCFITGVGIGVMRSTDLMAWSPMPHVFDSPPAWVAEAVPGNRGHFWAPDIVRGKDGRWLLYYSVSTFGKNTSVIALASNPTLDAGAANFAWKDEGIVVRSGRGDHFNAIDPSVTYDTDGRLWMAFGSFWDGIRLVELDADTGLRKGDAEPIAIARNREIEAAYISPHGGQYYLFVNWGLCCRGVKSTYEIRVGRADKITGPYLDKDGKSMADGGGTMFFGSDGPMIGPGHAGIVRDAAGEEQFSFHFYDATLGGRPMLGIRPLTWSADGWPELGTVAE